MLRRPIRQTQKSGAYMNAVVEDVTLGYATVRLANRGARLTRLPVMGGAVTVGDNVIVDWSAGVPPLVRPITTPYVDPSSLDAATSGGEGVEEVPSDVSFSIYGTAPGLVPKDSWSQVVWSTAKFQTLPFYHPNTASVLIIPADGYYFITAQVAAVGFTDIRGDYAMNDYNTTPPDPPGYDHFRRAASLLKMEGELRSSTFGVFGFQVAYSMDYDPTMYSTIEVSGMVPCVAGDEISLHLRHTDPDADSLDLVIDETDHLFPRIWGIRMTQGGFYDQGSLNYGTTGKGGDPGTGGGGDWDVEDDSDIEIGTNMGYLHVSEQEANTYARGIANVGDWPALELLLKYRFEQPGGSAQLRIFLRSTRDWFDWQTPTRGYEMSLSNTGGYGLHRVESGIETLLDSKNTNYSPLTYWLRFQADGLNVKAKVWEDGTSEPGWDLEVTDSGGFTDYGGLQLGFFNGSGDNKVYIDDLDLHAP